MKLETNVDAWCALRDGIERGEDVRTIAARHDLSLQMARRWARMPHPPGAKRLNMQRGATARSALHVCSECKSRAVEYGWSGRPAASICGECAVIASRRAAQDRIETLREWSREHGRRPKSHEAAAILGMSRSRAGELVIEAFGKARA